MGQFCTFQDGICVVWVCFVPLWIRNAEYCLIVVQKKFQWYKTIPIRGVQLEAHSTFFTTKMSKNLYCVPLVAHHEWESFVPLKLFLYQLVGQFCTFQDGICVVWVCFVPLWISFVFLCFRGVQL